jgi:hypothetical protein
LVRNNPLGTAAAFAQTSIANIKESFLFYWCIKTTACLTQPVLLFIKYDGYFGHYVTDHKYLSIVIPSRVFSIIFATWRAMHSRAIQLYYIPVSAFQYIPNNALEFRLHL